MVEYLNGKQRVSVLFAFPSTAWLGGQSICSIWWALGASHSSCLALDCLVRSRFAWDVCLASSGLWDTVTPHCIVQVLDHPYSPAPKQHTDAWARGAHWPGGEKQPWAPGPHRWRPSHNRLQ